MPEAEPTKARDGTALSGGLVPVFHISHITMPIVTAASATPAAIHPHQGILFQAGVRAPCRAA